MLYVVGLGSGSIENMTKEAFDTLESCSLIVGYGVYVDLIKDHFPHKEYYTTPMKQEIDRCKYAIEQAESGKEVKFDFSAQKLDGANRGVVVDGDYWYFQGINFYGAGDNGVTFLKNVYLKQTGIQVFRFQDMTQQQLLKIYGHQIT